MGNWTADLRRARDIEGGRLGCLRSPGVHALAALRFGQWCLRRSRPLRWLLDPFYVVLNGLVQILWGIDVSRRARIGGGLYIGHFGGIVVSSRAVIGESCNLSQGVTIGANHEAAPVIGNNVYIGPGAKLFGAITVGDNAKIGANAVIHENLPDNAVAVLDPGFRIVSNAGNRPRPAVVRTGS